MNSRGVKQYVKERDAVALTYDVDKFKAFYRKWERRGVLGAVPLPEDDRVIELTMRKIVCNSTRTSDTQKDDAVKWLIAHGSSPEIF